MNLSHSKDPPKVNTKLEHMATNTTPSKFYTGNCHCGNLKYRVALALDPNHPEANRCNCTLCVKTGFAGIHVLSGDFMLLSPSSPDDLTDYQFGSKKMHHFFCKTCGVRCMFSGVDGEDGKEFWSINVLTLDQVVNDGEMDLSRFKMLYWDGRGGNWGAGAQEKPYPGGCV
jgi:hypothetical protein